MKPINPPKTPPQTTSQPSCFRIMSETIATARRQFRESRVNDGFHLCCDRLDDGVAIIAAAIS